MTDKKGSQSDVEDIKNFSLSTFFDGRSMIWEYSKGEWGEVRFHFGLFVGLLGGGLFGFFLGMLCAG